MLPKKKNLNLLGFYSTFSEQLDHNLPLCQLAHAIRWEVFEDGFSKHYCLNQGKPAMPAKPVRLMVSLLILKQLRNLSDESVVEYKAENSYYQFFSGEEYFT